MKALYMTVVVNPCNLFLKGHSIWSSPRHCNAPESKLGSATDKPGFARRMLSRVISHPTSRAGTVVEEWRWMGCFRVGGWFLPCMPSQEPVRSISPTTPKRVEWLGNMRSLNCWNLSLGRIYAHVSNDGYFKDTLRRWYIHDLEQEFCGTSSNLNFLPHTTATREGIVEIVALWEMLERSGQGPQP